MPSAMCVLSVCDVLVYLTNLIIGSILKGGKWIDATQVEILSFSQIAKIGYFICWIKYSHLAWEKRE